MRAANGKRIPYFNTEATVDVEIDPDDLHEAGWHHEDECDKKPPVVGLEAAVASLHRQAHPSQDLNVTTCREEPGPSIVIPAGILALTAAVLAAAWLIDHKWAEARQAAWVTGWLILAAVLTLTAGTRRAGGSALRKLAGKVRRAARSATQPAPERPLPPKPYQPRHGRPRMAAAR